MKLPTTFTVTQATAHLTTRLSSTPEFSSNAQQIALWLIQKVTGKSHAQLLGDSTYQIPAQQLQELDSWVNQIIHEHKPVQYILGSIEFCSVTLDLKPPIFIPRPETEEWCSMLIEQLKEVKNEPLTIIDMCTGTGAIALALAHELKKATIIGCDINEAAVALATHNKELNKLDNVTFIQSNLFESIPDGLQYDMVISNPPYVTHNEWLTMSKTITQWEDKRAFTAPDHGLKFYELIGKQARHLLKADSPLDRYSIPRLVFEIGEAQKEGVTNILRINNYSDIKVYQDFGGKNRCITASF